MFERKRIRISLMEVYPKIKSEICLCKSKRCQKLSLTFSCFVEEEIVEKIMNHDWLHDYSPDNHYKVMYRMLDCKTEDVHFKFHTTENGVHMLIDFECEKEKFIEFLSERGDVLEGELEGDTDIVIEKVKERI